MSPWVHLQPATTSAGDVSSLAANDLVSTQTVDGLLALVYSEHDRYHGSTGNHQGMVEVLEDDRVRDYARPPGDANCRHVSAYDSGPCDVSHCELQASVGHRMPCTERHDVRCLLAHLSSWPRCAHVRSWRHDQAQLEALGGPIGGAFTLSSHLLSSPHENAVRGAATRRE
eukprot:scaffold1204_cov407-Prasinococcus_capsulatus_cf.AAC.4